MNKSEEGDLYSRRDLLRKGLMAGGSMALFGFTFTNVGSTAAAATRGSSLPSVSLAAAPQWPWGAAVNPVMPAFLSPDPGPDIGGADRTGIRAPLLVVPLLVSVDLGHPPMSPPFTVHIVATGDALMADSVQFDVPFPRTDGLALGKTQTQGWLGVFPVALAPGSIVLQTTLQAPLSRTVATQSISSGPTGSTSTLSGDFSQAPSATTLSNFEQVALVNAVGSQGFNVKDLFVIINDAVAEAANKLQEIKNNTTGVNIGDMFEMQMALNKMGQLDELSTGITSSINDAITSMARNIKG